MNYIFLDLEYNQSYNFDNSKTAKKKANTQNGIDDSDNCSDKPTFKRVPRVEKCPFEIIQIGAVKTNSSFEIIEEFNCYIKSQIYHEIHPYVEKITGIKKNVLDNGWTFKDAYYKYIDFIGNDYLLFTWGKDDIHFLYNNVEFYNIDLNTFNPKYVNVQTYATKYLKYTNGGAIGLKNAVSLLNIESDLNFHNALNDAIYTAKVFEIVKPKRLTKQMTTVFLKTTS